MAGNNSLNKQKEKLMMELENNLVKLEEALPSLKDSLDMLQEGDGKYPYWNGVNAINSIKNGLTQCQYDLELVKNIRECQSAIKK